MILGSRPRSGAHHFLHVALARVQSMVLPPVGETGRCGLAVCSVEEKQFGEHSYCLPYKEQLAHPG